MRNAVGEREEALGEGRVMLYCFCMHLHTDKDKEKDKETDNEKEREKEKNITIDSVKDRFASPHRTVEKRNKRIFKKVLTYSEKVI